MTIDQQIKRYQNDMTMEAKHALRMIEVRMHAYLSSKRQRTIMKWGQCKVMNIKCVTHVTKQDKELPMTRMALQSNLFLRKTSPMLGPHPNSIYFCMNQFHKFHHLELQNLIHAYFKIF